MSDQIDIESALEDAIFELTKIEDMRDPGDMRRKVASVLDECLLPAMAAAKANEKRVKGLIDRLEAALTASTIDRIATPEAKQDSGVLPVLQRLGCKVRMPNLPEFQQVILHWEDPATGKSGHGEPVSRRIAQAWIDDLRGDGMTYWLRECFPSEQFGAADSVESEAVRP